MSGRWATTCPTCQTRYSWEAERASPIPPCPKCKKALEQVAAQRKPAATKTGVKIPVATSQSRYDEAIELCDEIESLVDQMPQAGEDFGMSVAEKTADIRKTIEHLGEATAGQVVALENMASGLRRWIHD